MKLEGNHVMIDLETLGNSDRAVIISIGAVVFNDHGLGDTFYMQVDPQTCVDEGLVMDVSTVMWWMQQSDSARAEFKTPGHPLVGVLIQLKKWMPDEVTIWGNGATFDNVILDNAYKATQLEPPWKYYRSQCYRTMKNVFKHVKPDPFAGEKHNALADAQHQARHLVKIMGSIQ